MATKSKGKMSFLEKSLSLLLVISMMLGISLPLMSLTTVTASAAAPSTYSDISVGASAYVSFSSGGAKYFRFIPNVSDTYRFYSTGYSDDPYIEFLDANGNALATNDDGGDDLNFSLSYECTAGTTYYIKARNCGSDADSYTLNVASVSSAPNSNLVDVNATNSYSLFNSGRTGDGTYYNSTRNYDETSYTNGGYDLYANQGSANDTIQIGLPFLISTSITELARLNIYAFDVDEVGNWGNCNERDYIYLVDETTGARTQLSGYLSGQDWRWNNTEFRIDADNFTVGHTYHFELDVNCSAGCTSDWVVYVRTVNISFTTQPGPGPQPNPWTLDLAADILSDGTISAILDAQASAEDSYILEYKAVCTADNAQYGGSEYTVTIPTTQTRFETTFALESGAPRGTYEIAVFVKDSNRNVLATRTVTASYGYSAVSYNSNGGSQNLPTDGTTYSDGDTVTVKFDYIPSLYGYNFLGWSTDRYATEPMYTEGGANSFVIGSDDVTLYAIWAEVSNCEHDFEETSRTEPTCTVDGVIVSTCTLCGETAEESIPALGHDDSGEWIVDVEPTSMLTGLKHKECVVCGETIATEIIPTLAKLIVNDVEAKSGSTVRVTIDIQNNPGVLGAVLTIEYDPALALVGAEAGGAWSSLVFTPAGSYSNPCNFVWDGVDTADTGDGTLLVLTFEVPANVTVGTIYNINASYTDGNVVDENVEPIDLEIDNGSIVVISTIGDVNRDGIVDVADVVTLRRYLAGGYNVEIDEEAADMNQDGQISVPDIVLLRRYLVN